MGGVFSSFNSRNTKENIDMALQKAKQLVSSTPVFVFRVKQLLTQLGATFQVLELDQESDGDDIQAALVEWTGQRTVPNVFIGGKHLGGCDAVMTKHQQGQLQPMLVEAKAIQVEQTA